MVTGEVRIAAPDQASAQRLVAALAELEGALYEASGGWYVVVALKSPNADVVFNAVVNAVERWLAQERLDGTTVQIGDQPPTTIRAAARMPGVVGGSSRPLGNDVSERLAESVGYSVRSADGRRIGVVEHLRYGEDVRRPEVLVVRGRGILRRRRYTISSRAVTAVSRTSRTVTAVVPPSANDEGSSL